MRAKLKRIAAYVFRSWEVLTLYQYNLLSETERPALLWEDGVFLDLSRREDGFKILLYSLYSFYVEVWYSQEDNEIARLRSFSSTTPLDVYFN